MIGGTMTAERRSARITLAVCVWILMGVAAIRQVEAAAGPVAEVDTQSGELVDPGSSSGDHHHPGPTGLDGLSVVRLKVTDRAMVEELRARDAADPEISLRSEVWRVGEVDIRVSPAARARLEADGIPYEVIIPDLQVYVDQLFARDDDDDFFDSHATYDEHVAFMNQLATDYPDLVTIFSLGDSVEGRPMWCMKITGATGEVPGVMYHGAQHGSEPTGAMAVEFIAHHLLTNYATDPDIQWLVDHVEWYLLPMMNPDGYVAYRRYNANGVDLNRNWGGPGGAQNPFSQPETAAMRDFFESHPQVRAHIDFHGYVPWLIWPWGHQEGHTPVHDIFAHVGTEMAIAADALDEYYIGTIWDVAYQVRGGSVDYTYGVHGVWGIVIELTRSDLPDWAEKFSPSAIWLAKWISDCNDNGILDSQDLLDGTLTDCDENGAPDQCGSIPDCNENGISDWCDILDGTSEDLDGDSVPDECETTWYVDDDAPGDPAPGDPTISDPLEDGSAEHPFDAIQEGIDAALNLGDQVVLANGTYTGEGNRDLTFAGKPIQVRSASGDPTSCIIDCQGSAAEPHRGFHCRSDETLHSIVHGVTITSGWAPRDFQNRRYGGAIYCEEGAELTVANCRLTGNFADYGAGICCNGGSTVVRNTAFTENLGDLAGGACLRNTSDGTFSNCTFTRSAAISGGGLYCDYSSFVTMTNCVIWGCKNHAIYVDGGHANVTYSAIEGGWEGEGNIEVDPLLTPNGHLTAHSPCLDAGDPGGTYSESSDADGEPRLLGERVDMGADEFHDSDQDELPDWWEEAHFGDPSGGAPNEDPDGEGRTNLQEYAIGTDPFVPPLIFHVDPAGNDQWDGRAPAWNGASGPKATIQAAIDSASLFEGDMIILNDGLYTGAGNRDVQFDGRAITVRSASGDPGKCVVDCEGSADEPHRGFHFDGLDGESSVLYGISITGGYAYDNLLGKEGGGVYCQIGNPVLLNCNMKGNRAYEGGGVYSSAASPTIANCIITQNTAVYHGAGLYCRGGAPKVTNCLIEENTADRGVGGGIYLRTEAAKLSNSIIWGNSPDSLYTDDTSPTVRYCDVEHGAAGEGNFDLPPLLTPEHHLTADSPCRDAGDPADAYQEFIDIDGEPRLSGAFVDMGPDEFLDTDGDHLPDSWERKHFGDSTIADPEVDLDDDGLTNLQEYEAGRDPHLAPSTYFASPNGDDAWDGLCPEWDGASCGPKATIQAAIDLTVFREDDEIALGDGIYQGRGNRDLDLGGRAITIRSTSNDALTCVIDCGGTEDDPHRGFFFHSAETSDTIIQGVTIRNGYEEYGGGVHCYRSSPMFRGCRIYQNASIERGGGLYCDHSNATLENCTLGENAAGSSGGGMHCYYGFPMFRHCTITNNTSDEIGGGVRCNYATASFVDCAVTDNEASYGGGLHLHYGNSQLVNCIVSGNIAHSGGGVYSWYGNPGLMGCALSGNVADYGAGISCKDNSTTLDNCLISDNIATWSGGGLHCNESTPVLANCVVWGCTPESIYLYSAQPTVTYSDIQGGWEGEGNIDADPMFVQPGYWDDNGTPEDPTDDFWVEGDYRLLPGSPCIDAGNSTWVPEDAADLDGDYDTSERLPLDLAGGPRFFDDPATDDTGVPDPPDYPEVVDMGAYEYHPASIAGDLDFDGDVDLDDYAAIADCLAGADVQLPFGCAGADLDLDDDVDIHDFAAFGLVFGNTTE
jgi:hypothetical protein